MAGQRRLDRDLCRLRIADLAHSERVRNHRMVLGPGGIEPKGQLELMESICQSMVLKRQFAEDIVICCGSDLGFVELPVESSHRTGPCAVRLDRPPPPDPTSLPLRSDGLA